ncbi:MAG: RNA polymerase sigma factor RpoD/SigA [Planctomycetaceae bacterium]|jgi:RNA polymerase primary sigma factor|nr:RNA polymerase sigma factor RpoD/SigA [Planctomycetaceae bacterium]
MKPFPPSPHRSNNEYTECVSVNAAGTDERLSSNLLHIYLRQMKDASCLQPAEETAVAEEINKKREIYYNLINSSDFAVVKVLAMLRYALNKKVRLDRCIDFSVFPSSAQQTVKRTCRMQTETLQKILNANRNDFEQSLHTELSGDEKDFYRKRIQERRSHAARIIREMGVRMSRILPQLPQLHRLVSRLTQLQTQLADTPCGKTYGRSSVQTAVSEQEERIGKIRRRICFLQRILAESPESAGEYLERLETAGREYSEAKNYLASHNLRLVVAVAKKYQHRGLSFLDMIQEGNIGLLKAADRFQYRQSSRFGTFAVWWIRQAILRGIADSSRTVRVPVYTQALLTLIHKTMRRLENETGNPPSLEQTAARCKLPAGEVVRILQYELPMISLDNPSPCVNGGTSINPDEVLAVNHNNPAEIFANEVSVRTQIDNVMNDLSKREQDIIRRRYGLLDGSIYTLDELGRMFSLTRERIRQIEVGAIRKLRRPVCSQKLGTLLIK